jgi:hypothetical protein
MKIHFTPRLKPRRGSPVKVGNVYATKQGLNGYFIVVGILKVGKHERPYNNITMLRFNMEGEIIRGLNEPEQYVQNHKDLVGEIKGGVPSLEVEWYEHDK